MSIKSGIAVCLLLLTSCRQNKDHHLPATGDKTPAELRSSVDSSSIVGLYKFIFSSRCDVRGCHDGTFEPNFTTVESAYYTLVYHPVIKNNQAHSFTYRVVPYDTSHSVLYERITNCCFVNEDDRMPQLGDKEKLGNAEVNCVARWIMNGAKNIDGKTFEPKESLNR